MTDEAPELFAHRPPDPASDDPFVVGPALLLSGSPLGPLAGTRFAVKDLYDVAGTRRGDGNPDLLAERPVATRSAPPVVALVEAGADCVGKTVTDELAFSLSGTNVHYGTPLNPIAPDAVPGGSSAGSVAAVASGAVDFALATDTAGSTRVPASYCGLFGLRATHGRIAMDGVMRLAESFCSFGLFAREPVVLRRAWGAVEVGASEALFTPRAVTELLIDQQLFSLCDDGAAEPLRVAAGELAARAGLPLREVSVSGRWSLDELRGAFRVIQMAEAWRNHGPWISAHPGSLGGGIAARFEAASHVGAAEVEVARALRAEFQASFAEVLGEGGVLVQPAASGVAPRIDLAGDAKDDLRTRTLTLTCLAGLAGAPALTVPAIELAGRPVGLCLVGLPGDDDALIDLAMETALPTTVGRPVT